MSKKASTKRTTRTSSRKTNKMEMEMEMMEDIRINTNKKSQDLTYNLNTKFKNVKQKELYNAILDNRIIFLKGSAGTGKTFVALFAALNCLKTKSFNIKKIILTKPYLQVGNNNNSTGYLKGTLEEKIQPYFTSFYSNLNKLIGGTWTNSLKEAGFIEDKLLNFVRGETFGEHDSNGNPLGCVAILDEGQNTTVSEMKTYISRMGEDTKLIILGDSDQIDIKLGRNEISGLDDAFERFKDIDGIAFIEFNEEDIVRDKFLIEIMKRYK